MSAPEGESKPMKVGIIGAGGVAIFHYKGYTAAGAEIVAIADVNPAAVETRQRMWHIPRGHASFESLLADPEIEAVSVCLPNALHHPATLAAAKAGKHVLVEKPISLSLEQAQEMIDACRQAGVTLQVGHHLRSDPAAEKAKRMVERGELGRITYLRLRQAHDWGGANALKASFTTLATSGGGTLLDNGCHMMDWARYFGGDVSSVYARAGTLGFDIEVDDTAVATLEFASGAFGTVEAAWTATGWEFGFWIYGTKGAVEYSNRLGKPTLRHTFRDSPGTTWDGTDVATYTFGGLDGHSRSVVEFLAAIRGEREVICTGEDGLEAVRLILAAYESARAQRPVALSGVAGAR